MDCSIAFKSTQSSVPSPCGNYIATLHNTTLEIRSLTSLNLIRQVDLPQHNNTSQLKFLAIRWAPPSSESYNFPDQNATTKTSRSTRLLLTDEETVRVIDVSNTSWSARIDNGSGGLGKIVNVIFGKDEEEVLVFSSFGARLTVWDLRSGRRVEMKDPKFVMGGCGYGWSRRNGLFALLRREGASDVLELRSVGAHEIVKRVVLETVDSQGVRWSDDGNWMVVWDTPSIGCRVSVYTADGNLYRTYSGDGGDSAKIGLGVKSIEWSPRGDFLAVGGHENTVTLLNTRTFATAAQLTHSSTIRVSSARVWQEQVTSSVGRTYKPITQPMSPPSAPATPYNPFPHAGISQIKLSCDGSLLATKDDSIPTTVWIWDLRRMQCTTVLIQHAIIQRLLWHPTDPNTLVIQCNQDEQVVYLWSALNNEPRILDASVLSLVGRIDVRWVRTGGDSKPIVMVGNQHGFALAYPNGRDDRADENVSFLDVSSASHGGPLGDLNANVVGGALDDTFQYKKNIDVR